MAIEDLMYWASMSIVAMDCQRDAGVPWRHYDNEVVIGRPCHITLVQSFMIIDSHYVRSINLYGATNRLTDLPFFETQQMRGKNATPG